MGVISTIKRWIDMIFKGKAEEDFAVKAISSPEMETFISTCARIYKGQPDWLDDEDDIRTINFAKSVASETARLATMAIKVTIDGSARGKWLQAQIDKVYFNLRHWVEYGGAYGTVILKPNGTSIDVFLPGEFFVTDEEDGEITGAVFHDMRISDNGKTFYNRYEYHRTDENGVYRITNRCYRSESRNSLGEAVSIEETPWKNLTEDAYIANVDRPLFGVLRMPAANNIDEKSPLGMPVFAEAIEELKDLDIAYSRNAGEIENSRKIVLLDSDRLLPSGGKVASTPDGFARVKEQFKLPHYIKNVYGDGTHSFYQEIQPSLNTEARIKGINNLLSQIGYKCGFSNGYFVFDEKTGMVTATQVEADDRRTIGTIKDVRDKLEDALDGLLYALDVFATLYDLAPAGSYEAVYDFGDITYNREEDKQTWWKYVVQGAVPKWMYFVKFEGMTEEDAKAMIEEAQKQNEATGLFDEE